MSSGGVKRSLEDEATPQQQQPPLAGPSHHISDIEPGSPLSSVSSSTANRLPDFLSQAPNDTSAMPSQGAKRRKLTEEEKAAAQAEKEKKAQEREAEKQRKLEEKKMKDEEKEEKKRLKEAEKAVKDAEKEAKEQERKEKQEKRDAEKKAKEEEKRVQEEAKAKKERAQMRLTGFFAKPKDAPQGSPVRSRQCSVSSQDHVDESPRGTPVKTVKQKLFLPFEIPSHGIMAPYNRYARDGPAMQHSVNQLDEALKIKPEQREQSQPKNKRLAEHFDRPFKRVRYTKQTTVKSLVAQFRGTTSDPIDLTELPAVPPVASHEALRKITVKSFKFKEDVRPPYIGTFTKTPELCSLKQLSRDFTKKALRQMDYDYDSEAEWEDPGEGEDLLSEGEEEADDEDEEDMDGFLDDEDAEGGARRQQVLSDMEPVLTEMHWEASKRTAKSDVVPYGEGSLDMAQFRIETLIEQPIYSIDPHSTAYWTCTGQNDASSTAAEKGLMPPPPRVPLNSLPANLPLGGQQNAASAPAFADLGKTNAIPGGGSSNSTQKQKAGRPAPAPFPPELLGEFKAAIEGSKLTKLGLVEVLKAQFPTVSKNTVQETLEQLAERVGAKATDKLWVLRP